VGAVMPDPEAFRAGNAVAQQAMELMSGYAQDAYEVSLAQNAAEAVAQASELMSPKDAYKQVSQQFFKALHEHRQDQRTNINATAQGERFEAVQKRIQAQNDAQNERLRQEAAARAERDRLKAEAQAGRHKDTIEEARTKDFLRAQEKILVHGRIVADRTAADTIQQLEELTADPNSIDKEITQRVLLILSNNKGSTSNEDAKASAGLPGRALEEKWYDQFTTWVAGKAPNALSDMRASIAKLKGILLARTLNAYRSHRDSIIANAPNDYARKQALANLRQEHKNFGWAPGEFYLEDHPEARPAGSAASKPQTAVSPAPSKPKPKGKKAKPKATSDEKRLDDEVDEMLDNGVQIKPKGM